MTRLTENFYLDEFLFSQTASRHGIDMTPDDRIIENLGRLCVDVLQPLRDSLGPIYISSGYRPEVLNTMIGGSRNSAHRFGLAADIVVPGFTPYEVCRKVLDMYLVFDQLISEFGRWTHIGIAQRPRKQVLTAYRDADDGVRYARGLMEDGP